MSGEFIMTLSVGVPCSDPVRKKRNSIIDIPPLTDFFA
jgi:hypothetical protein